MIVAIEYKQTHRRQAQAVPEVRQHPLSLARLLEHRVEQERGVTTQLADKHVDTLDGPVVTQEQPETYKKEID